MESEFQAITPQNPQEPAIRDCIPPSQDAQSELTIALYADDFVVLHKSLEVILQCKSAVADWLKHLSLELKPSKTRISHTLNRYAGNVGFEFLGFHIRQYPVGRHQSGNNPHGEKLGFKTIIRPSPRKIDSHVESLRNTIDSHKTMPQAALIPRLNSIIRGWSNYYSTVCSKRTGCVAKK